MSSAGRHRRLFPALLTLIGLALLATPAAADQTIDDPTSTGVTSITIGAELSCQATLSGVAQPEFFGGAPGSCGTHVLVDRFSTTATTYGPQAASYGERDSVDVSASGGTFT